MYGLLYGLTCSDLGMVIQKDMVAWGKEPAGMHRVAGAGWTLSSDPPPPRRYSHLLLRDCNFQWGRDQVLASIQVTCVMQDDPWRNRVMQALGAWERNALDFLLVGFVTVTYGFPLDLSSLQQEVSLPHRLVDPQLTMTQMMDPQLTMTGVMKHHQHSE